jgi:phenylalanyl-tRNA synthetase beta chain
VGWLGELHPALVRRFELPAAPVAFELDLAALLARPVPRGRPVSRQPVVRRDLALVVDESVGVQRLVDVLARAAPPFVVALRPFDLFRGGGLPNGRKSVAILVLMQDTARTLTDAEIEGAVEALAATAHRELGATLRSQDAR